MPGQKNCSTRGGALGLLTGYLRGRATLAGRDHDQELHDGVIDPGAPGLDDKHVLFPDTSHDPHASFALKNATDKVSHVRATMAVASDGGPRHGRQLTFEN